jgi:hypothetical protein
MDTPINADTPISLRTQPSGLEQRDEGSLSRRIMRAHRASLPHFAQHVADAIIIADGSVLF